MIKSSLSRVRSSVFVAITFSVIAFVPFLAHAAIGAHSQQSKDLQTMMKFIENHPLVLEGLVKIRLFDENKAKSGKENPHVREVVYTIQHTSENLDNEDANNNHDSDNNTKIETIECIAKFTPTFLSMFLPAQSISFSRSSCAID